LPNREACRANGRLPPLSSRLCSHDTSFSPFDDDRTDDCAFGADDVALRGSKFRKLRFLMIADTMLPAEN